MTTIARKRRARAHLGAAGTARLFDVNSLGGCEEEEEEEEEEEREEEEEEAAAVMWWWW